MDFAAIQQQRPPLPGEYELPPIEVPATLAGAIATIASYRDTGAMGGLVVTACTIQNSTGGIVRVIDEHGRRLTVQNLADATFDFTSFEEGGSHFVGVIPAGNTAGGGDLVVILAVAPPTQAGRIGA